MIPSPLEDLAAISGAATPDALWRHLVANPHMRASWNGFDALVAFERLHRRDARQALRTAQLLCTDLRWRRVTGQLVGDLEETAILGRDDLRQLADAFL